MRAIKLGLGIIILIVVGALLANERIPLVGHIAGGAFILGIILLFCYATTLIAAYSVNFLWWAIHGRKIKREEISEGQFSIMWRFLKKHQLAMVGGYTLLVLYSMPLFGDFVAPYSLTGQNRKSSLHPPTPIYFWDENGKFGLRPFIYEYKRKTDPETFAKTYQPERSKKHYLTFLLRGSDYTLWRLFKTDWHLFGVGGRGRIFLLGSDDFGRDVFSRLVHGGRISLSIGLVAALISFPIGLMMGGISGYFGGRTDNLIQRFIELIQSIPTIYAFFALRAVFPPSIASGDAFLVLTGIFAILGWTGLARVIRGMVLSLKEQEFSVGAKALGASTTRIIMRHIIPNTFSYLIVSLTLGIPSAILGESALSVLGLGIQEPFASWGNMLAVAKAVNVVASSPWLLIPGLAIFIAILSWNLLGDGLRDAADPRHVS